MAYRDNVTKVAERFGIVNDPVQGLPEDQLTIAALTFYRYRSEEPFVHVEATDMNKGGRLFYQHCAASPVGKYRDRTLSSFDSIRKAAREYFAETWDENPDPKRSLIYATTRADYVEITYKTDDISS